MKKSFLILVVLSVVSAAFAANTAPAAGVAFPDAVQELPSAEKAVAMFLKRFTARFYHAAEISGITSFSPTEKQHIETAAARFAQESFYIFQKAGVISSAITLSRDATAQQIQDELLHSRDREELLCAARKIRAYVCEYYPDLVTPEVTMELRDARMKFFIRVAEAPSMPRLSGKVVHNFWNAALTPAWL